MIVVINFNPMKIKKLLRNYKGCRCHPPYPILMNTRTLEKYIKRLLSSLGTFPGIVKCTLSTLYTIYIRGASKVSFLLYLVYQICQ